MTSSTVPVAHKNVVAALHIVSHFSNTHASGYTGYPIFCRTSLDVSSQPPRSKFSLTVACSDSTVAPAMTLRT